MDEEQKEGYKNHAKTRTDEVLKIYYNEYMKRYRKDHKQEWNSIRRENYKKYSNIITKSKKDNSNIITKINPLDVINKRN